MPAVLPAWNPVGRTITVCSNGRAAACALASTRWRTGPHCMKMMGWWPSLRVTVADSPRTNRAFARRTTCSKLCADRWWHSSTTSCPYWATQSFTTPLRTRLWMTATSSSPVGFLRPPPMRPTDLVGRSRNLARRSIHWSKSWRRCTSTSVLTPRWAISQAATTVLPNAVVAAKIPVSCFNIASAASLCSVRSSPWKVACSGCPLKRSSRMTGRIFKSISTWRTSSRHPRGKLMCCGCSSAQPMIRGLA